MTRPLTTLLTHGSSYTLITRSLRSAGRVIRVTRRRLVERTLHLTLASFTQSSCLSFRWHRSVGKNYVRNPRFYGLISGLLGAVLIWCVSLPWSYPVSEGHENGSIMRRKGTVFEWLSIFLFTSCLSASLSFHDELSFSEARDQPISLKLNIKWTIKRSWDYYRFLPYLVTYCPKRRVNIW